MKEYELSEYDFEALDLMLKLFTDKMSEPVRSRLEQLKDKFAKAHSAILFIEEEE